MKNFNIEYKYGYALINGEYYEHGSKDGKVILKQVDRQRVEKKIEKCNRLAKELKKNLDSHKVMMEAIIRFPDRDIDKLTKMLFESKKKYTVKTREHRCVDMKVGNFIIPIVE